MVDDPDAHGGADKRHLETCAECQARYGTVSKDALAISSLMAAPELKLDVTSPVHRVRSAPPARPGFGFRIPVIPPRPRPLGLGFSTTVSAVSLLAIPNS